MRIAQLCGYEVGKSRLPVVSIQNTEFILELFIYYILFTA